MSILHDPDRARQLGFALAATSVVAVVVGVALFVAAGGILADSWLPQNASAGLALAIAFAAMLRQQPNNAAVWVLGWAAVILSLGQALLIGVNEWALADLVTEGIAGSRAELTYGMLPTWLAWSLTLRDLIWVPGWVSLMTLALLLFPDGRLPSPRWRLAVGAALVGTVGNVVVLLIALRPSARSALPLESYPFTPALEVADLATFAVLLGAIVASVASLVVRYRAASGDARRQIRWIAVGGGMVALAHLLWLVALVDAELAERLVWLGVLASVPALAASYAVAILRYRLYDIDVVISRSLVVAALAGFIAAVYVAVVVVIGRLVGIGGADEASLGLKVAATAIVAVAFQPLRRRLRRWADRLVYGQRATPYEVLAGFSRQATGAGDPTNLQRIAEVLAAGTGAEPATIWLRVGDQLRPVASSDATSDPTTDATPTPVAVHHEDLPELPGSLVVDVRHDRELLGALTLTKPRAEPPTRQDEELTARLARGLALMLRNARLTAELRDHLRALEASRARLVHAQDEARRAIQSQLGSGAQQHLDQLSRHLADARRHTAAAGAQRTTALLDQLEHDANDAVNTLDSLARGIYPPLLEAHGLLTALTAQTTRSALPTTVHAPGLPRYPPDVEAAVYFSILEALQNASRYAQATSVHVRVEQRDDHLHFEVSDDGIGFDPSHTSHGSGLTGIAARLDTLDGYFSVRARPGSGTHLTGRIPLPALATKVPA